MELRAVLNSEREFPSVSKESTARQSTEKIRNREGIPVAVKKLLWSFMSWPPCLNFQ